MEVLNLDQVRCLKKSLMELRQINNSFLNSSLFYSISLPPSTFIAALISCFELIVRFFILHHTYRASILVNVIKTMILDHHTHTITKFRSNFIKTHLTSFLSTIFIFSWIFPLILCVFLLLMTNHKAQEFHSKLLIHFK